MAIPLCQVTATLTRSDGLPAAGEYLTVLKADKDGLLITDFPITYQADSQGVVYFPVPQGSVAYISANTTSLSHVCDGSPVSIPNSATATLADLSTPINFPDEIPVAIPAGSAPVKDDGAIVVGAPTAFNFGAGLTVTNVSGEALIDVTGGPQGSVSSVFNRTGAVIAQASDYAAFYAPVSHSHDAAQIISGVLSTARLGTGVPSSGNFLRGDGTWANLPVNAVLSVFGRTGTISAQSADYSLYYAPISHTHTRAQITDLGIFSTSQPGLVPQPTALESTKFLRGDGSWQTVSAGPGGEVSSVFGRTGDVTAFSSDYAGFYAPLTHTHAAGDITSGIFSTARLGSGTPDATKYLRGDGSWQTFTAAPVLSVFGRTGAIQALVTDYSTFYAPIAHTHAAGDVTSGIFSTARLGTGTADQNTFLRGDGVWTAASFTGTESLNQKTLQQGVPVELFEVTLPSQQRTGGQIFFEISASDATTNQVRTGQVRFQGENLGGLYQTSIPVISESASCSEGTLTASWTIGTGTDKVIIRCQATSSISAPTLFNIRYQLIKTDTQAVSGAAVFGGLTQSTLISGLPDPGVNGLLARTGVGTTAGRQIIGTSGQITVTNPDALLANPQIALAQTSVTPGSYTSADITVDAQGRLTAAASGTAGAAARPGFYNVADYGASGLSTTFTGQVSASSVTLQLTAASDFVVGHGIAIKNAGAGSSLLVTRVQAISADKRTITLRDAAAVTQAAAQVQHDDTEAIQAALLAAFNDQGGVVEFDFGHYRVNGAVNPTYNSILYLPFNPHDASHPHIAICLRGESYRLVPAYPSTRGPVIQTDRVGTNAESAIFNGGIFDHGNNAYVGNFIEIAIEGLTFRTYDPPQISALDLGMLYNATLRNVMIDAGQHNSFAQQPIVQTFGLRIPRVSFPTVVYCENVCIANYYSGVIAAELINANQVSIFRCHTGLLMQQGTHLSYGTLVIVHCIEPIKFEARNTVSFELSCESYDPDTGEWFATPNVLVDLQDLAHGRVSYYHWNHSTADGSVIKPITTQGCSHLSLFNLGNATSAYNQLSISGDLQITGEVASQSLRLAGKAVSQGAPDSGGTGYKLLRVQATDTLSSGLVSYWKLDETGTTTRVDQIGNLPMTVVGTPTTGNGILNQGFYTDTNAYLQHADSALLDFTSSSFSITGWVWFIDFAVQTYAALASKWGAAPNLDFLLLYIHGSQKWIFQASPNGTTEIAVERPGVMATGQWYFIAAVWDSGASQLRLSINNETPASLSFAGPVWHSTQPFMIGNFSNFTPVNMVVDEVALYNRVLTATEITQLYNSGLALPYPFS